uniref:Uncharacterized protein n=1 Tax=Oryza brachyantha TaxID=4533 RepID=J3M4B9_ORYBR
MSSSHRIVDLDPQKREDRREEDGPDDDDGRTAVLPAHETLEEGVEMQITQMEKKSFPKSGPHDW